MASLSATSARRIGLSALRGAFTFSNGLALHSDTSYSVVLSSRPVRSHTQRPREREERGEHGGGDLEERSERTAPDACAAGQQRAELADAE